MSDSKLSVNISCHLVALLRDLSEDETIYISYTSLHHPTAKRRETLREQYYFDCGCSKCCEDDSQV